VRERSLRVIPCDYGTKTPEQEREFCSAQLTENPAVSSPKPAVQQKFREKLANYYLGGEKSRENQHFSIDKRRRPL
jgi:hypothetical protein